MSELADDTAVHETDRDDDTSVFTADLSSKWAIWGPMGGYIASIALRAAGAHCRRARPASINVAFLATADFDRVQVTVQTLRTTRVATATSVAIVQDDRTVLQAIVWGTDTDDGLEHHTARRHPEVDPPESLPAFRDRLAAAGESVTMPFWDRLDYRPTGWIENWDDREPTEPEQCSWYRFPGGPHREPWLDGCRLLIATDLDAWGAATLAHTGELDWFAPTIELTCRFLQPADDADWLLSWGAAPVGRAGVIGVDSEVWSADHRLLATGGSTLLCRPAPQRPDQ